MVPLLVGIAILLLVHLLVVPYSLYVIGLIVGVVLIIYGLWIIFTGFHGGDVRGRRVRYW